MYRSDLNTRDKSGAIAAVIAVHAALALAVLHQWGDTILVAPSEVLKTFNINDVPPPPPPPPPPKQRTAPKPKEKEGGSAPKNIKSEATPVVAPKPKVVVPPVPQIAASETPRNGTAPTQGASDVRGPGTGAGGVGNGTGNGSGGNGSGGGGDGGGVAFPPRLVTPVLTGRNFPRELIDQWPSRTPVFLRLRINAAGYVSECTVDRRTGVQAIDSTICNIAHERLRFRPAANRFGQPVAGWVGYAQPAPR